MFEETAAMAKNMAIRELSKTGQVGHVEKRTIIPDTNGEYVDLFGDGTLAQRVSEPIDLYTLSVVHANIRGYELKISPSDANCAIYSDPTGGQSCVWEWSTGDSQNSEGLFANLPTEALGAPAGLYATKNVVSATFETIHTIDPKYLPGVCLPVVELSTVPTAEGAELTAEETAVLSDIMENHNFALVKFSLDGTSSAFPFTVIASKNQTEDDVTVLVGSCILGVSQIVLCVAEGVGYAHYEVLA